MKLIYIILFFLFLGSPVFSQIAVISGGNSQQTGLTTAPTNIVVYPTVATGSEVQIVVENPPKGSYILELVEPPSKKLKFKMVTNTESMTFQVEGLDLNNVLPGNYFVIYQSDGVIITKPVIVATQ